MLYEYKCKKCGKIKIIQRKVKNMYDDWICECGYKNNGKETKLLSKSNFVLKGAGWFRKSNTDNPEPSGDYSLTQGEINKNQEIEKEKVAELDNEVFGTTFD